jgi:hypothetical protein
LRVTNPAGQTVYGNGGDDTIIGSTGQDLLYGGTGNDTISGGANDDYLYGDEGADTLNGDAGADYLSGDAGADTLNGGDGGDVLHGDAGDDQLFGGDGGDVLYGDAGDDRLFGDADDDYLSGGDGADVLNGGAGDDRLSGDAGADTLNGGAGADELRGGAGADTLSGGAGNDTYIFSTQEKVYVPNVGYVLQGYGHDTLTEGGADGDSDTIVFIVPEGISGTDVYAQKVGNDLVLSLNDDPDNSVTIKNFYPLDNNAANQIERIEVKTSEYAMFTVLVLEDLKTKVASLGDGSAAVPILEVPEIPDNAQVSAKVAKVQNGEPGERETETITIAVAEGNGGRIAAGDVGKTLTVLGVTVTLAENDTAELIAAKVVARLQNGDSVEFDYVKAYWGWDVEAGADGELIFAVRYGNGNASDLLETINTYRTANNLPPYNSLDAAFSFVGLEQVTISGENDNDSVDGYTYGTGDDTAGTAEELRLEVTIAGDVIAADAGKTINVLGVEVKLKADWTANDLIDAVALALNSNTDKNKGFFIREESDDDSEYSGWIAFNGGNNQLVFQRVDANNDVEDIASALELLPVNEEGDYDTDNFDSELSDFISNFGGTPTAGDIIKFVFERAFSADDETGISITPEGGHEHDLAGDETGSYSDGYTQGENGDREQLRVKVEVDGDEVAEAGELTVLGITINVEAGWNASQVARAIALALNSNGNPDTGLKNSGWVAFESAEGVLTFQKPTLGRLDSTIGDTIFGSEQHWEIGYTPVVSVSVGYNVDEDHQDGVADKYETFSLYFTNEEALTEGTAFRFAGYEVILEAGDDAAAIARKTYDQLRYSLYDEQDNLWWAEYSNEDDPNTLDIDERAVVTFSSYDGVDIDDDAYDSFFTGIGIAGIDVEITGF